MHLHKIMLNMHTHHSSVCDKPTMNNKWYIQRSKSTFKPINMRIPYHWRVLFRKSLPGENDIPVPV